MTDLQATGATSAAHALNRALAESWDRGDVDGYGLLFTDDVDYIPVTGTRYQGRREVVESHRALFSGPFRGTTLNGRVIDVRTLAPSVAVVHRVGSLRFPGAPDGAAGGETIQTMVIVEREGRWEITAFQNTDVHDSEAGRRDE